MAPAPAASTAPHADHHGPDGENSGTGRSTIDLAEVEKFAAMAESWWDPVGKFRPLHRLNPVRVGYIRDKAIAHFGRDAEAALPLADLSLIDIGSGGGLLAEPLARLGASVTGVDATPRNVEVARLHAEQAGVKITYLNCAAEDLVAQGKQFDVVLAMEVIEHVADVDAFLGACAKLLKPGGLLFLATMSRTVKSYAMAIVGAEYIMRWLPRGTHDWNRFIRPSEMARGLRRHGLELAELTGVSYNPFKDSFRLSRDLDVNYMALAKGA
ncbi:bifunctional 2-polyprenyl-6-hydroxyphenol methylase/3-demethylubiquinol 3-O-methyltransferase UbiG [Dongia rigui]|uniref:Ubiquinone biosynthesis O-methyltransferase n=1 Tax=Dongia rigui TaxID=940149 RepID=A0ABU5E6N0_9PROT|nr:bifunctional 2-polyprenyl-6-hydroxyphenol methylase/3-demethylubiquinol 3-O-methyltransferase UbiG [Dongia rigui]MDY0874531.1 bifunctional 2-polyprenyl-6-hydroxyphenol methylase/3-demethylubiquinol 3-O-methyltransferase UbiG [Dongia rigui]